MNVKKILLLTMTATGILVLSNFNNKTSYAIDNNNVEANNVIQLEQNITRGDLLFLIQAKNGADIKSCPNTKCVTVGRGEYGDYLKNYGEFVDDQFGVTWIKVEATNGAIGWVQTYKGAGL